MKVTQIFTKQEPIKYTKGWGKEGFPKLNFGKIMEEHRKKNK